MIESWVATNGGDGVAGDESGPITREGEGD